MSQNEPQRTTRNRRAQRHYGEPAPKKNQAEAPQRASFPIEETAPMPLGGYDATPPKRPAPQVYEESSYAPPRSAPLEAQSTQYDEYYDDEYLPPRRWPWVLLGLLTLVILVMALSYFIIPDSATGILGQARQVSTKVIDGGLSLVGLKKDEPPRLIKFDTPENRVQTGVKTVFTFTADKKIDGIRILDEVGSEIAGVAETVDANSTTWTLTAILTQPATTTLSAGILHGKTWYQTDKTVELTVAEPTPIPVTPVPETPVPSTPKPTAEPSAIPPLIEEGAQEGMDMLIASEPVTVQTQNPFTLSALLPVFTPAPDAGAVENVNEGSELLLPPDDFSPAFTEEPFGWQAQASQNQNEGTNDLLTDELPESWPLDENENLPFDLSQTDTMEEEPIEEPVVEAAQTPAPTPLPTASPMPVLTVQAADSAQPERLGITEAAYLGGKRQADYTRAMPISAQGGELYTYYPGGVFTFRGDSMRQNAAFGTAEMPLSQLSIFWQTEIGSLRHADGTVYGVGWTGQPAIVKWALEVRAGMNLHEDKKDVRALKEVIFAGQDGKVHFLDLEDGQPTRDPIDVGYPLKSSVSVDPSGRPLIAFGQAISKMPRGTGDIGFYLYSLVDQKRAHFINGRKSNSQVQYATNGAFDGTALFDRFSDTMIIAGENGLLYTAKLNTVFDYGDPTSISIDPEIIYLRSKAKQDDNTVSIESSVAMYGQYAFMADKRGILKAVDTTSMKTVWAFDTGDNTDASPALDLGDDLTLSLYTGTTVHARTRNNGQFVLRRMNALTGEETWAVTMKAKYDALERAGAKASPIVGQNSISNLVIFTVNMTEEGGAIIALNKENGQEVWKVPLQAGAISSPVAVYRPDGSARIVQADSNGRLYLLDGPTGQILHTLDLGGTVEGSPAVYNDILVIGTSSKDNNRMYGIRLE